MKAANHTDLSARREKYLTNWSNEAKEALSKVPFFVRKRVKRRVEEKSGYRIQVGGKLGRHPRLATELPLVYDLADLPRMIDKCVDPIGNIAGGESGLARSSKEKVSMN